MTKWEYIRLISRRGAPYGDRGGVLDLLTWCRKDNTAAVTEREARRFYEMSAEECRIECARPPAAQPPNADG